MALSPLNASACGTQIAEFGLSWIAPSNIEFHLNAASGPAVAGQFGSEGTTTLFGIPDGTLVFMVQSPNGSGAGTLASARASVTSSCTAATIAPLGLVNAASYAPISLAPDSLATVFGVNLSPTTAQAGGNPYPTTLGGVSVSLGGQACPLWYVSSGQINFAVPSNLASGRYTLAIGTASSDVLITNVSPGIFTVKGDGTGVPLASISGVLNDNTTVSLAPYQCSGTGCDIVPMVLPANLSDLYIVLYGTGIRHYGAVSASLGSFTAEVSFAGAQGQFPGLDQINLHLKGPFGGLSGLQTLQLQADGMNSNPVSLEFK